MAMTAANLGRQRNTAEGGAGGPALNPNLDHGHSSPTLTDKNNNENKDYIPVPDTYTRRRLNSLYREIPLKDTTSRLLRKYFNSMANLYGIIPLKKAYEIIAEQSPTLVTEQEFLAFAEIARHECEDYYILEAEDLYSDRAPAEPMRREIVDILLVSEGAGRYRQTKETQRGKPYYIPPKKELLLYNDAFYCDETPAVAAMKKFLANGLHLNEEKAAEIFQGLLYNARCLGAGLPTQTALPGLQDLIQHLDKMGVQFATAGDAKKFMALYQDFHNNTRMQCNCGHTPNEIAAMRPPEERAPQSVSLGPNIRSAIAAGSIDMGSLRESVLTIPLPNEAFRLGLLKKIATADKPTKPKKVGRNAPCPCGSGKKYKRCCGR